MGDTIVTFADAVVRTSVLGWEEANEQTVEDCIAAHATELYGVPEVIITAAKEEVGHLILHLSCPQWEREKEVGLSKEGSLFW